MAAESDNSAAPQLARRLGTGSAVVIGLGSMIGAGVFTVFAPAADAAGTGLLIGLAIAAVVAYCNATSSARLAARYPESGGAYVYGRERLGLFWGYLAGWGFVVGKIASCAAMALTVAAYILPNADRLLQAVLAVAVVVVFTGLNYRGVHKSAWLTTLLVAITLLVLTLAVIASLTGEMAATSHLLPFPSGGMGGILQSAGLLFFAFAGYARIATLGEEVRDPQRTIPRAIPIALGITLIIYVLIALAVLIALGPDRLASVRDPLASAVAVGPWPWLTPIVRVGATVAALGSLLALILGVSRTVFAMARDGHLPKSLSAVHSRFQVPHYAEVAVGVAVVILVSLIDLRGAIGFSSFAVLVYYAIANASAWTLRTDEGRPSRIVSAVGLFGCLVLAFTLPSTSIVAGSVVLALGAALWVVRHVRKARR